MPMQTTLLPQSAFQAPALSVILKSPATTLQPQLYLFLSILCRHGPRNIAETSTFTISDHISSGKLRNPFVASSSRYNLLPLPASNLEPTDRHSIPVSSAPQQLRISQPGSKPVPRIQKATGVLDGWLGVECATL